MSENQLPTLPIGTVLQSEDRTADIQLRAELRSFIYRHIDRWDRWPTSLQARLRDLIEEAMETP